MQFQIRAHVIKGIDDIQPKLVFVNDDNYILIRKRLELEKRRAVDILIHMKSEGMIKAINKPKSFMHQKSINILMNAKGDINNSIIKIKEMFYKK